MVIGLLLSIFTMPYWYYQSVRIFGTIGFFYLAYKDNAEKVKITPPVFFISAVLLNPLFKISFGKKGWMIVDIILAVILGLSIIFNSKLREGQTPNRD